MWLGRSWPVVMSATTAVSWIVRRWSCPGWTWFWSLLARSGLWPLWAVGGRCVPWGGGSRTVPFPGVPGMRSATAWKYWKDYEKIDSKHPDIHTIIVECIQILSVYSTVRCSVLVKYQSEWRWVVVVHFNYIKHLAIVCVYKYVSIHSYSVG